MYVIHSYLYTIHSLVGRDAHKSFISQTDKRTDVQTDGWNETDFRFDSSPPKGYSKKKQQNTRIDRNCGKKGKLVKQGKKH